MPWLWRFFSRISFVPSPSRVESCIHFVRICKRVKSFLKSRDNIYYIYYLIQRGVIVARIQYRLSEMFYFVQNDIFRTTISSDSFPSNNLSRTNFSNLILSLSIDLWTRMKEKENGTKESARSNLFRINENEIFLTFSSFGGMRVKGLVDWFTVPLVNRESGRIRW